MGCTAFLPLPKYSNPLCHYFDMTEKKKSHSRRGGTSSRTGIILSGFMAQKIRNSWRKRIHDCEHREDAQSWRHQKKETNELELEGNAHDVKHYLFSGIHDVLAKQVLRHKLHITRLLLGLEEIHKTTKGHYYRKWHKHLYWTYKL